MSEQFGLVFLVLFVLAAAACIYLSITMSRRVQRGINRWRDEEMQSLETQLRDLANPRPLIGGDHCRRTVGRRGLPSSR
jgi:hypothetical protein